MEVKGNTYIGAKSDKDVHQVIKHIFSIKYI